MTISMRQSDLPRIHKKISKIQERTIGHFLSYFGQKMTDFMITDFMITGGFWRFSKDANTLKFQCFAVRLRVPRGICYLFVTEGHNMIEIRSDNKEILVKTCNKESLISQLNELRQICAATIGTIAHDHALPMDKVMGGFLLLLEEDDDW